MGTLTGCGIEPPDAATDAFGMPIAPSAAAAAGAGGGGGQDSISSWLRIPLLLSTKRQLQQALAVQDEELRAVREELEEAHDQLGDTTNTLEGTSWQMFIGGTGVAHVERLSGT